MKSCKHINKCERSAKRIGLPVSSFCKGITDRCYTERLLYNNTIIDVLERIEDTKQNAKPQEV